MRIIAGRYRSRPLVAPPGEATRPTSDRLRETLFNVLAARVPGSVFFDLFAGSGAVAIEALSRGAQQAYAVESGRKAVRAIEENARKLGLGDELEIVDTEVADALRSLAAAGVKFDICFLDPPYQEHGAYERTFRLLADFDLAKEGAIVIAEHEKHFDPGDELSSFRRYRTLKQGDAVLSFYQRTE